jgi:hypothetical protein
VVCHIRILGLLQEDHDASIFALGETLGSALVAADLAALITHKRRSGGARSSAAASPVVGIMQSSRLGGTNK